MNDNKHPQWDRQKKAYSFLLLAYLAVLPVAGTIALRNLLLLVLLILLLRFALNSTSQPAHSGKDFLNSAYWPIWAWLIFLCLFPLWAKEPEVALRNLLGQWGTSIAAWVIGLGAAWMLGRRGPGLWALAAASGLLVAVHLTLTLMAWAGLFGARLPENIPIPEMWALLRDTLTAQSLASWSWQAFPWRFRGFDPMHGNLGYTATQAVILLLALLLAWKHWRHQWTGWAAALGILLCLGSVMVAQSRGSVLYQVFMLLLGLGVYVARLRVHRVTSPPSTSRWKTLQLLLLVLLFLLGLALLLNKYLSHDKRWSKAVDTVRVASLVKDPLAYMCLGITSEFRARAQELLADRDADYFDEVMESLEGDGSRIVLMRLGAQLVLEHPWGLDGSRESYMKLMQQRCGHAPAMLFFHTHQGWLDLSLALGWAGVLLWAFLLGHLVRTGWRALANEKAWPWALALLLMTLFWAARALLDSIYREHNLQMQALLLAYLFGRLKLELQGPIAAESG